MAAASTAPAPHSAGFDFTNHGRNALLTGKGFPVPKATSTGTTIVGTIFNDGVVLGADTRATEGPIVADKNCEKLFTIAPHGSTDKLPYVTMGSGSLAAMAVFESGWKKDMTRDEAIALVTAAIESGIYNDLGSGSNVDVCIIEKQGTEMLRNYRVLAREAKEQRYGFRRGTTAYTKEEIFSMIQKQDVFDVGARPGATTTAAGAEAMDTS
ncbi:unnamed protein product [Tilletia controversa]|nr:unnamed protein product [Tilletia controversa]